jgi:SapC
MITELDDLAFAALPKPLAGSWHRPKPASLAEQVMMAPVADSEILQLSQSLPLIIEDHPDGLRVMALLHALFLARPLTNAEGQWLPGYAPVALRALPLRRRRNSKGQLITEMLRDPRIAQADGAMLLAAGEGGPAPEIKALLRLADRLSEGRLRLHRAACALAAAGLLEELHFPAERQPAAGCHAMFTVASDAFAGIEGLRVTALSEDALIGFELAAAMEFSRRTLAPGLVRERRPREVAPAATPLQPEVMPGGFAALDVLLDGSELISFEQFQPADSAG